MLNLWHTPFDSKCWRRRISISWPWVGHGFVWSCCRCRCVQSNMECRMTHQKRQIYWHEYYQVINHRSFLSHSHSLYTFFAIFHRLQISASTNTTENWQVRRCSHFIHSCHPHVYRINSEDMWQAKCIVNRFAQLACVRARRPEKNTRRTSNSIGNNKSNANSMSFVRRRFSIVIAGAQKNRYYTWLMTYWRHWQAATRHH